MHIGRVLLFCRTTPPLPNGMPPRLLRALLTPKWPSGISMSTEKVSRRTTRRHFATTRQRPCRETRTRRITWVLCTSPVVVLHEIRPRRNAGILPQLRLATRSPNATWPPCTSSAQAFTQTTSKQPGGFAQRRRRGSLKRRTTWQRCITRATDYHATIWRPPGGPAAPRRKDTRSRKKPWLTCLKKERAYPSTISVRTLGTTLPPREVIAAARPK